MVNEVVTPSDVVDMLTTLIINKVRNREIPNLTYYAAYYCRRTDTLEIECYQNVGINYTDVTTIMFEFRGESGVYYEIEMENPLNIVLNNVLDDVWVRWRPHYSVRRAQN